LKGWEFLFLRKLVRAFLKTRGFGIKPRKSYLSQKTALFSGHTRDVSKTPRGNDSPDYEATNIGLTYDAEYFGWKRVSAYYKEFLQENIGS